MGFAMVGHMNKPKKCSKGSVLDYHDAIAYIEEKYKIDTHNYKNKTWGTGDTTEYCDFWHWFIEYRDIHNGSFQTLHLNESLTDKRGALAKYNSPDWVKEILRLLKKEFAPRTSVIDFWAEW